MIKKIKYQGFTLVELAVVLVVVGVLLGGFIGTLASRIENTRAANTKESLEEIKEILIGYAYSNNTPYLPCPDCIAVVGTCVIADVGDGIEDRDGNDQCSVGSNVGALPWVTLGLSGGDAWGNRYRYWVDIAFSDSTVGPPDDYFDLNTNAGGRILERTADGSATQELALNVAAVVISQGKNAYGAISTSGVVMPNIPPANFDEIENTNNNNDFVSRPPSDSAATTDGGEFDDIVIWISEYKLKAKMVEAGVLP